ncbi:DUF4232 domain-containing protein [Streptomyces sp. NPDC127091]|uniref:DUF4232 domain-containing protein n=1 Tax=Streptomyces cathayae TaxID=3031124 RepID=A0ABY8JW83_9ACTN|nr:DUF4232 domain-containing protein [Streptomyces sp. HUAS 5]WGD38936.1 DUF4232 domain-containing protein [Streptomyces sp. HUAS 5]
MNAFHTIGVRAFVRRAAVLTGTLTVLGAVASCGTGTAAPGVTTAPDAGAASASVVTASARTADRATARCHTSELRARVGGVDPGAGQRNFPVVLTNVSSHACTLYGHPGAAFVDASGRQLGPDPKRSPGDAVRVALEPGESAWAGLRYSAPGISGARTATPAALLVTPPDERDSLKVPWTAGAVPIAGDFSAVFVTVLSEGTGP